MDLYDTGFSNIRLPNDNDSYIYTYIPGANQFPEEVVLHEFLHSLERIMKEYGYDIPALHDNEKYGYKEEKLVRLKNWYQAYMTKKIWDETKNEYIGLDPSVYKLQPVNSGEFEFPVEVKFNEEPKNIIDEVTGIFGVITRVLTRQEV